jgi:hypothetical protein
MSRAILMALSMLLVHVGGAPPGNLRCGVKQHFHEADHPGFLDLDAGTAGFTCGDIRATRLST